MSSVSFTVIVNLSSFRNDHRLVRIFVDEKLKTIEDLEKKITKIFGISNFFLTAQNEFLPPSEDARILRPDEIIWANPSVVSQSIENKRESIKNNSLLDQIKSSPLKKKRSLDHNNEEAYRSKKHTKLEESIDKSDNSEPAPENNAKKTVSKHKCSYKTVKIKSKHYKNFVEHFEKSTKKFQKSKEADLLINHLNKEAEKLFKNETTKDANQQLINADKALHVNGTTPLLNSFPPTKKSPLPAITNKNLEGKKINIFRIDYLKKPTAQISQNEENVTIAEETPALRREIEIVNTANLPNSRQGKPTSSTPLNNENEEVLNSPEVLEIIENTTNHFFLNNPLPKEKAEAVTKPKNENVFQHKKEILSPVKTKFIDKTSQKSGIIKPVGKENVDSSENREVSSTNNVDVIKKKEANNEKYRAFNDEPSLIENIVAIANDHSYPILNETNPTEESQTETEFKNYDPLQSLKTVHGVKPITFLKNAGVGQLLQSLRKSNSNSSPVDSCEFVSQRKRQRTRKRQKNKNKQQVVPEEIPTTPTLATYKPPKTVAAPKQHIKFSSDENEDSNDALVINENLNDESTLNKQFIKLSKYDRPKINDLISFKVLKLSDNFTPEISPSIKGRVVEFCTVKNIVTFEIIDGAELLKSPRGKFSLDEDDCTIEGTKDYLWENLIEPILLNP